MYKVVYWPKSKESNFMSNPITVTWEFVTILLFAELLAKL